MTNFWLSSEVVYRKYSSLYINSSYIDNSFIDFGLLSNFDNGIYFDFQIRSEYLNLNGDLSLGSSFVYYAFGERTIYSRYNKGIYNLRDFSLSSKLKYNIFTEMHIESLLESSPLRDFTLISSFRRDTFSKIDIKSFLEKKSFISFSTVSMYEYKYDFIGKSMSIESSFVYSTPNEYPKIITLDSMLHSEVFFINIFSGNTSDASYDIGAFSMTINNYLNPVYVNAGEVSVTQNIQLNNLIWIIANSIFMEPVSLDSIMSAGQLLTVEESILTSFYSKKINIEITRRIVDYADFTEDSLSIDIHNKELDVRSIKSKINIPFADILNNISSSPFVSIIELPKEDNTIDSSVLISGFSIGFKPPKSMNKFYTHNIEVQAINLNIEGKESFYVGDTASVSIRLPALSVKIRKIKGFYIESAFSFCDIPVSLLNNFVGTSISADNTVDDILLNIASIGVDDSLLTATSNPVELFLIQNTIEADIIITDTSFCSYNGRECLLSSDNSSFTVTIDDEGYIHPSIHLPDVSLGDIYSEMNFSIVKERTYDDISIGITASVNNYIVGYGFDAAYFKYKPNIVIRHNFNDVLYSGTFRYTSTYNLLAYISEYSYFSANMFFNGNNYMSEQIGITVVNYDDSNQ